MLGTRLLISAVVIILSLAQVSQYLERLTGDLEAAAHPALDALTGKVSWQGLQPMFVEASNAFAAAHAMLPECCGGCCKDMRAVQNQPSNPGSHHSSPH